MKSILQSIQPQWCELIASGKKTIEVRKTKPKIPTPFKVYVYCTKDDGNGCYADGTYDWLRKVPFEYVCDYIEVIQALPDKNEYDISSDVLKQSHLSQEELWEYGKGKTLYGWHISDLKIYDKPKYLSEFCVIDKNKLKECPYRERICQNPEFTNGNYLLGGYSCSKTKEPDFDDIDFCRGGCADVFKSLTHPPLSWCYVYEI